MNIMTYEESKIKLYENKKFKSNEGIYLEDENKTELLFLKNKTKELSLCNKETGKIISPISKTSYSLTEFGVKEYMTIFDFATGKLIEKEI